MKNPVKTIIIVASSAAVFGVMYPMAGGTSLLGSQSAVGNCSAFAPGHSVGAQSNVCGSAHGKGHSHGHH